MNHYITVCLFARKQVDPNSDSAMIMRAEKLPGSHMGTVFEDADANMKVKDADDAGVLIHPLGKFLEDRKVVRAFRIRCLMSRAGFSEYAWGRVKRKVKYSDWQLYLNQALRLIGINRAPIRNGDAETICCEESYIDLRTTVLGSDLIHDQDRLGLRELVEWLEGLVKQGVIEEINPDLIAFF